MKTLLLFVHFFVPTQKCLDDFHSNYTKFCDHSCWWTKKGDGGFSLTSIDAEPHEQFTITTSSVAAKSDCYEVFVMTLTAGPAAKPEEKKP